MKHSYVLSSFFVLGVMIVAGALSLRLAHAQGLAGTPEQKAKQMAIEKATPQLAITEDVLHLSIPGQTMGQTVGVSKNSKGHLFVYSRTGPSGIARGGTAAMLFEFDENNKFVKIWGPNNYAASFAHSVRVDKYDNVWMIDEGSGMLVKFDTNAMPQMQFGRTLEAIDYLEEFVERGEKIPEAQRHPVGRVGIFNRPTDVTWDSQDNIYISDGYTNSRFVKLSKDGSWVKAIGTHGSGPDQFSTPHGIASDGTLVYVADRGNNRIQIYDGASMTFKTSYTGVGAPWSVQVTQRYVYSGDGTGKIYRLDKATGKLLGWIQTGMGQGQTGCIIHELHAVSDNVLIKGSCSEWNVEKITFKGSNATQ